MRLTERLSAARAASALLLVVAPGVVTAQDAAPAATAASGGWQPTLDVGGGYLESRSRADDRNGREFRAFMTPGLSYVSRAGSVRGSLSAASTFSVRRGVADTAGNDVQNWLTSAFITEVVRDRVFVDLQASIGQQAISAFGEQSADGQTLATDNQTEVRTLSLTPYVTGRLGGAVRYDVRVRGSVTRNSEDAATNSNARGASIDLKSEPSSALLGWTAQASTDDVRYENREPVVTRRALAGVQVRPGAELQFTLRGGQESVREGSIAPALDGTTYGGGVAWQPSPRTRFNADVDERYFGRSGRVSLSYRGARSVLSYGFARDVSQSGTGTTAGITRYDELFAQAASTIDDPVQRDLFVRDLLNRTGQDGTEIVSPGFQTSTLSVVRQQDLSYTWLGVRTTLVVQGFTTAVAGLTLVGNAEPLRGDPIRQHGYSSSLSHRLTPLATVQLGGSRRMTYANASNPGNDLKSAFANWTQRVGVRTFASAGLRYTVFNSSLTPYRETSATASLNLRF